MRNIGNKLLLFELRKSNKSTMTKAEKNNEKNETRTLYQV